MHERQSDQHLSRISTQWTMLRLAHQGEQDVATAARQTLMQRYCGAVYRYLLGAVRDPHEAEDLTQEFALRFVRGLFKQADPQRGRFRDYVKTSLFHLVDDHRRRQAREPRRQALADHDPAAGPEPIDDGVFLDSWRKELLARAWEALSQEQERSGQPYFAVLRLRAEQPDLPSARMADQLTARLGRAFSAAGVRQLLHRAREKFSELLLQETADSLGDSAQDRLAQELADLSLLKYCQPTLDRRAAGA
jgi:RNA polymerase sigma-70 factor (ECF subfamily)